MPYAHVLFVDEKGALRFQHLPVHDGLMTTDPTKYDLPHQAQILAVFLKFSAAETYINGILHLPE